MAGKRKKDCPFCNPGTQRCRIAALGTAFAIFDINPVSKGHTLIVTFRHVQDYFSMSETECRDAHNLAKIMRKRFLRKDRTITGFNYGANCGRDAGQMVMHAHMHLIPRRPRDRAFEKRLKLLSK